MLEKPMSDLPDIHAKIDTIIERVAALATRGDLAAAITATRAEVAAAIAATRADLTEMRVEIMARIDRVQDATTIQHHERVVDVASSERAERLAKAARDDATALGEIVTPLVRVVHMMRTQLDDLAEQVRVLKAGRAA